MRSRYKPNINHNTEFELDLAPLLAVMVKLVPVMLVSSAFVQMMIIETELPQVIQEAIKQQEKSDKRTTVSLNFDKNEGAKFIINENGREKVTQIGLTVEKQFDFEKVHQVAKEIKTEHPEVFKIEINPSSNVLYKDIVKFMDEVRKSKSTDIRFPVKNENSGETSSTDYMFPEVVFNNTFEG